jgi:ElaA protein
MIDWRWNKFSELDTELLYQILKLRIDVFVVEQNCPWADLDNFDQKSWHLCALDNGMIAGYARLLPPDDTRDLAMIQRVIVAPDSRGSGLGRELMLRALAKAGDMCPNNPVKISAQARLEKFYRDLGFVPISDPYDDLGIMHIDMIYSAAVIAA